jgi:hypothetical protein
VLFFSYSTYKMNRSPLKAEYLQAFLGHGHLGDGRQWHSIVGMRVRFGEYFSALASMPPQRVTVVVGGGASGSTSSTSPSPTAAVPAPPPPPPPVASPHAASVDAFDWAAFRKVLLQMDGPLVAKALQTVALGAAPASSQEASHLAAQAAPLPRKSYAPWAAAATAPKPPWPPQATVAATASNDLSADQAARAAAGDGASGSSGAMSAHPDLLTWSKAAASRARNPYLPPKAAQEFIEDVVPAELAQELLKTCQRLALEWGEDLAVLAWQDSADAQQQRHALETDRRKAAKAARRAARLAADAAALEPTSSALAAASEQASAWAEQATKAAAEADAACAEPAFESTERGRVGESSPLRRLSFDLLLRATTVLALKDLQEELAQNAALDASSPSSSSSSKRSSSKGSTGGRAAGPKGADAAAALQWLTAFEVEGGWFAQLAEVTRSLLRPGGHDVASDPVAARLLTQLDLSLPCVAYNAQGREATPRVDPPQLAHRLRALRCAHTVRLMEQLSGSGLRCDALAAQCASRALLERASTLDVEWSRH